jgi:hypothetical protein
MPPKKKAARPRPVYFETTIPVIRPCPKCGVWTAAGVAEGLKAEVEIVALSPRQLMRAVVLHVELYVIRRVGLIHMDTLRLQGRNMGYLYPQHRCDIKWAREVQGAGQSAIQRYPDEPPF